jgi:hypothetical protein
MLQTRPCVCNEMSQDTKQLDKGRKLEDKIEKKKNSHRSECRGSTKKTRIPKKIRNRIVQKKKSYQCECPLSVDWHSKVPAEPTDQIRIVLSRLPEASLVPSLFQATDMTRSECPFKVDWHLPVFAFHTFIVSSQLPLAKDAPSGLHATDEALRLQ